MNRRHLLTLTGIGLAGGAGLPGASMRFFDARDSGASGDGKKNDTTAVQRSIDSAFQAGGGVAYVPPGAYLCGTLVLKSNVTLYLEAGATILGSKDLADYQMHDGPPRLGDANQKHLIFARDAVNVGLAGPGTIDGQGPAFWVPSGRRVPPPEDDWRDVATYDWKPLDRASPLVEFAGCRNVRVEDVTIQNASGWTLRPIACNTVVIRGIKIRNPVIGPNTDGIDPTCCQNVFISDCLIDTGDDAICLKSENPYGDVLVSKNITISNCVLTCCCNGIKFGTATRGGFENVAISNVVIVNEAVNFKARVIAGLAIECVDGGWVEGVVASNLRMQNVRTPIFVRLGARRGGPGRLRGVMIDGVHATGSILTSSVTGIPGREVEDVTLRNIRIDSEEGGKAEWTTRAVPENEKAYPEARMFGRLPAYGLYSRHVNGLHIDGFHVQARTADERPALVCDDVRELELAGLAATAPAVPGQPLVRLVNVRRSRIRDSSAPSGCGAFLRVEGSQSARIALIGNDLTDAAKPFECLEGAPADAVYRPG